MKKIAVKIWPIGGICFLLLIGAFFVFKVPQGDIGSPVTTDLEAGESLRLSEINYSQDYRSGEKKWELRAKEGCFREGTQTLSLKAVSLQLNPAGRPSFTIKGNEGDYFRETGRIVLRGGVVGRSDDGYRIETSLLAFSEKEECVESTEATRVTGPFFYVRGDGLVIDLRRKTFSVKGNVCATFDYGGL
jgi:LPS export ABC transporter protein LptC